MDDTTGFWLASDCSTLTQVNSFSRQLWQAAEATAMKLDDMRVHYDRDELRREDLCADPFKQFAVNGVAERVPVSEALAYFLTRPFGSQNGACASPQSQVVSAARVAGNEMGGGEAQVSGRARSDAVVWGGFRVVPRDIEFWQGRGHRLHDRFLYTRLEDGNWNLERLAP